MQDFTRNHMTVGELLEHGDQGWEPRSIDGELIALDGKAYQVQRVSENLRLQKFPTRCTDPLCGSCISPGRVIFRQRLEMTDKELENVLNPTMMEKTFRSIKIHGDFKHAQNCM